MAIVHGKIETLKRLRVELSQKGISRFNSIGDINDFIKDYKSEKQKVTQEVEHDLNQEIDRLRTERVQYKNSYDLLRAAEENKLNQKVSRLNQRCIQLKKVTSKNILRQLFIYIQLQVLISRRLKVENKYNRIVLKKTFAAAQKVSETDNRINDYILNRERIISERSLLKTKELDYAKEVVDKLGPLIAGAIGENLVVKELEKLSDKYVLFNDFSIKFDTPIYNKRENDRIYSIQIDHLLVTHAGVFIIETKNWSKASIENQNLRSPIKQVQRTGYAMYTLLNGHSRAKDLPLKNHHWGDKEIPVQNVIAMINHKPKARFKFVTVVTLKELNGYLSKAQPIFSDSEVREIFAYLIHLNNQSSPN